MTRTQHWERIYADRAPDEVSWYEAEPRSSLAAIEAAGLDEKAAIIDIGGGASNLAHELLRRGYTDITVADLSETALQVARSAMEDDADRIGWIVADAREHDFGRQFDLWHDRVAFHFMVDPADREGYLTTLRGSLRPGGQVVIATFGPEGPVECSGLPVQRYSLAELSDVLGDEFEPVGSELQIHETPAGREQQFLWARFRRRS